MAKRGPGLSMTSTGEGARLLRQYYEALGRFVAAYARTEGLMQLSLRILVGLMDERGAALLSGVRADQAANLMKRLLDATRRPAMKERLGRHFQQFNVITTIRNELLHYGAEFETAEVLLISNARDAFIPERLKQTQIVPADFYRMNADLQTIRCGLIAELDRGQLPASEQETWDERARAPWQYKPPPQGPHRRKTRKGPSERRSPPASSPQ